MRLSDSEHVREPRIMMVFNVPWKGHDGRSASSIQDGSDRTDAGLGFEEGPDYRHS